MTKRFGQKFNRASFKGSNCHQNIAVPGDKDDRKVDLPFRQFVLKIQSIEPRKPDIKNDAARRVWTFNGEKFFRCAKCPHTHFDRSDEAVQSVPDRGIIIDDKHNGFIFVHHHTHPSTLIYYPETKPAHSHYKFTSTLWMANGQGELKNCPVRRIRFRPHLSPVSLDNRAANCKAHTHTVALGRIKGMEETIYIFCLKSRA